MSITPELIKALPGPILIIGAGGFLGANLFHTVRKERDDVFGTVHRSGNWRLEQVPSGQLVYTDMLSIQSQTELIRRMKPAVIFDCAAFGAYSFEKGAELIHRTNFLSAVSLLELCEKFPPEAIVFSGSSSEYGLNCEAPGEDSALSPDSDYAVSKAALSGAVKYYGKVRGIPCVNLRLYSLYGPYEDTSRLMPVLSRALLNGEFPPFVSPETTHDFLWVGDAVEAYLRAAAHLKKTFYGESYNIGTGIPTSIRTLAETAGELFRIGKEPQYNLYANRAWDHGNWYANPEKAFRDFGWKAETDLKTGLRKNVEWWKDFLLDHKFETLTKKGTRTGKNSVSAVIACYRDNQAIPVMYERLKKMFTEQKLDYEIIFVNDASPDDSTEVIRAISEKDPNVRGIVHSRNFGSQAAFLSGLELSTKEAAVLMDGDLQDPPEMIADFVREWRAGADVVYGRRVKREMPVWLEFFYHSFYWLFSRLSEVAIPRDAGDFSLLDRKVIRRLAACPERDFFLRGIRAYIGYRQVGIDYVRPERMFGKSTNNWIRNIGWAKKAIFSFSRAPLHLLSAVGLGMTVLSILFGINVVIYKVFFPELAPRGISMLQMSIMLFGSLNLLAVGLLGEYIGKIIEETKRRPRFIRNVRIENGNLTEFPPEETGEQT